MQSMIKKYSHIPISEGKEIEVEFMDDVNGGDKVVIKKEYGNIIKNVIGLTGIPASPGGYCSVAISRDGNYVAVVYGSSPYINVYKKSTNGWDKLTVNGVPAGTYYGVGLSDDGTYLVASLNTSPYIVFFENTNDVYNKLSDTGTLPAYLSFYIAITPDNYVLYHEYSSPYNLYIYNIATRDLKSSSSYFSGTPYYYDIYYGDRTLIAVVESNQYLYLFEYESGGNLTLLKKAYISSSLRSCAFSLDGKYITTGYYTYEIIGDTLSQVPIIQTGLANRYSICGFSHTSWLTYGETNQLYLLEVLNGIQVYTNKITMPYGNAQFGMKRANNTFISAWNTSPYGVVFETDFLKLNKAYKCNYMTNDIRGYGIALNSATKGQRGRALVLWGS